MSGAGKVTVASHVITQGVGDETILLNTETESFISLNDVGAVIWESLRSTGERDDAVAAVVAAFEADANVEGDVADFIDELVRLGAVQVSR